MNARHGLWVLALLPLVAGAMNEAAIIDDIAGLYPGAGETPEPDIVAFTPVVDGIMAVGFNPVIREVPNVFVYRVTAAGQERVLEGLTLGIEVNQTTRIDLHTQGVAVDMAVEKQGDAERVAQIARQTGLQTVDYGRFMHAHLSGRTEFFLDKTMFEQLRETMLDPEGHFSEGEAATSCVLYDLPSLKSLWLEKDGGRYVIKGKTGNFQEWRVSFSGVDNSGRLLDKEVSARRVFPGEQ